jgi:putative CocE/NonD family hydrolase
MRDEPAFSLEQDVFVEVRDGVSLATDVYRPVVAEPVPVVVARTPYGKNGAVPALVLAPLIERGYAVVAQDCRGRFNSGGTWVPFFCELADGYDTVEWAARQPWSNGRVAMMGASYGGYTQLAAAMMSPPSLVTIMPFTITSNFHESLVYRGAGVLDLNCAVEWTVEVSSNTAKREGVSIPELAELWRQTDRLFAMFGGMTGGQSSREVMDAIDAEAAVFMNRDLLGKVPGFASLAPWFFEWLEHPAMDAFWAEIAPAWHYPKIKVPALHQTGWFDVFLPGGLENFTGLRDFGGSPEARSGQMIVIDPSMHGVPDPATPTVLGDRDFGPSSRYNLLDLQLRWLDYWVKGEANGLMDEKRVKLFTMGTNTWREEHDWPLPGTQWCKLYLASAGRANSRNGDGRLILEETQRPSDRDPDQFVSDPANPVPTLGGSPVGIGAKPGPFDQGSIEDRDDILVYTSPTLESDLDVTGPVSLEVWVATDALDTHLVAKLLDVDADGRSIVLCDGVAALSYRYSPRSTTVAKPGAVYSLHISLTATSNLFAAGHRIRLDISSTSYPHYLPPDYEAQGIGPVAIHRVMHDDLHPSALTLPVIGPPPAFPPTT